MTRAELERLAASSVRVLLDGQDVGGAYVAAPGFPPYRHAWLRDGAFCAWALSRAGRVVSAERFFGWASRTVVQQADQVAAAVAEPGSHYLPARYAVDGRRLDDGWWDRQHDGYGTWLWVMEQHRRRHGRLGPGPAAGIRLTVQYLLHCWSQPSFDWWEEHDGHRHTATLAAVAAGLRAAAGWVEVLDPGTRVRAAAVAEQAGAAIAARAVRGGRLTKWLDDADAIDAVLLVCATPFGLFEPADPIVAATLAEIELTLVSGGVHRHPADTFYGGGAWPLLSGLLGLHYLALGRVADARRQLCWIAGTARDGALPEQDDGHLLAPRHRGEWLRRWGEPACPLLWSHAMYLLLALELGIGLPPGP